MKAVTELSEHVGVLKACDALSVPRASYYRSPKAQGADTEATATTFGKVLM